MLAYPLTHPAALECLPLVSPRRVQDNAITISETDPLRPAYDAVRRQRSQRSRELGVVVLAVLDPPPDPDILATIRPLVFHLLVQHRPSFEQLFREETDHVFALLREQELVARLGVSKRSPRDYAKSHPLTTMHLLSATRRRVEGRMIREGSLTPAYRKYALRCHLAFREVEEYYLINRAGFKSSVARDHIYQCGWSLRLFMQYLSFVEPGMDPETVSREIERSILAMGEHWLARGDKPDLVFRYLNFHRRNIVEALDGRWERRQGLPTRGDPGGASPRPEAREDVVEVPALEWPDDLPEREGWRPHDMRCVSIYPGPVPVLALFLGECEDDYAKDVIEVRGPLWHGRRAAQMAALREAQRLHRDAVWFPFSAEYVQLHDYARLYRALFERPMGELSVTHQASVCVLLLLIHTGLAPEVVCAARIRRGHGESGSAQPQVDAGGALAGPVLSVDAGSIALYCPVPLEHIGYQVLRDLPSDAPSRSAGPSLLLPLPPFLHDVVESYLASREVLLAEGGWPDDGPLFLTETAPPAGLAMEDVADYLRARGEANPRRLMSRIGRSFFALYVSRLGLDPVLACYISARAPRIFATQLFYAHVDGDRLARAYWTTARRAHRLLWGAAGLPRRRPRSAAASPPPRALPPAVGGGCGSRIVPTREAVARLNAVVRESLARLESRLDEPSRIRYYNLYMAWGCVNVLLSSGMRPVRDKRLSAAIESPHPTRIRIVDKYIEARTIYRHGFLRALHQELEKARHDATTLSKFDHLAYEALGCPLVFFLEQDGRPVAVTPGKVAGILEHEVPGAFPLRLNAGRHLLETELGEARADRPTLDYSLGHSRRWREALNRFSMADIPFMERHFAEHIQRVIEEYGFEVLPYRPGTRV